MTASQTNSLYSKLKVCFLHCFFFKCYGDHRDLHSFPTRRSSDLGIWQAGGFPMEIPALSLGEQYMKRSEEHTSELQSHQDVVCRLLLEKKNVQIGKGS